MAAQDLVLVDTCIWVPFFSRPHSVEKRAVDELLDDDRTALIGPIFAEILLGFRRDEQADWVASTLRGLHILDATWAEWRNAARLGRRLIATSHLLPLILQRYAAQLSVCPVKTCVGFESRVRFDVTHGSNSS